MYFIFCNHKIIQKEIYGNDFSALLKGEIAESIFWERILNRTRWDISTSRLKQLVRNNFTEIEGTRTIVKQLKNYNLALLSNHAKEWITFCEETFAYESLFTTILYSFEIGICKPDKKIYETILDRLGEKAENCLFIDDNLENIRSAQRIGFKVIQFKTPKQLKGDLQTLSIKLTN